MREVALAALVALVACAHESDRPVVSSAIARGPNPSVAKEASGPRVRAFGFTTANLAAEEVFLLGLELTERDAPRPLAGVAFDRLVGLDGARAHAARVALGDESLVLTAFDAPSGQAIPKASRSNDLWFEHAAIVVSDMDKAYARVVALGGEAVSSGPQTIPRENPAAGGIRAYYFRDHEGHDLEIIWYPVGKGDPRWQDARGALFLGLDHSAIAVSDTEKSLAFYRDLLGLHVAGEAFNAGKEQEALSGVAGARVRITGLRGASGPGVEFLEYLAPRDGRAFPKTTSADLAHWEITLEVDDVAAIAARAPAALVSRGVSDVEALGIGARRAALMRDPDGHVVRLVQR